MTTTHNTFDKVRVGHFSSIPWIPFYNQCQAWPVALTRCESSTVRGLVETNNIDITPMSCADWFSLSHEWKRLGKFGIGFRGKAGSVLFFSNTPIHELDKADIAICDETTNSMRVLHALLTQKYKLKTGVWRRNVDISDATTPRLLIQNQAVEEAARGRFKYIYDIGHEWWTWQSVPIISAVWVYRHDLEKEKVNQVRALLETSLDNHGFKPLESIAAHKKEHNWPSSVESIQSLLGNFEYILGEEAEAGIERMRQVLPKEIEALVA